MLRIGIAGLLAATTLTPQLGAQRVDSIAGVVLPRSREHVVHSRVNGGDYLLWVALPRNYVLPADTTRYDVVYLLDGRIALPTAATAYRAMTGNPRDDKLIFVGVLYPLDARNPAASDRRDVDFAVPPLDTTVRPNPRDWRRPTTHFGAPEFRRVLREEVIPFIDRTYRTTPDRGVVGMSLGGLFATYILFEDPDLFTRYGIRSPSLWWDDGAMFTREAAFAKTHRALRKEVYISFGQLENPTMIQSATRLAATLRARNYDGLTVRTETLIGENHSSSFGEYTHVLQGMYLHWFDAPRSDSNGPAADTVRQAYRRVLSAYQQRDTRALARLASASPAFQAIVDDTIVDGAASLAAVLDRRQARWRNVRLDHESLHVDYENGIRGVVNASYQQTVTLTSGRRLSQTLELSCEFRPTRGEWRLVFLRLARSASGP